MHSDLIPTTQAAEILGVERSTLSRWVTLGYITPAMRTSERGAMLFNRTDIGKFAKTDRAVAARARTKAAS